MGFQDFYGNSEAVALLRGMLARDRFPHAVILAGPEGSGKYTLAQMIAKAMICLALPPSELPDFCGRCPNCTRIAEADNFSARYREAVEARESLREADRRDTRVLLQTHPDVLIIPPDPPQVMIKVDQVRQVIARIYKRPAQGRHSIYIFTSSAFMKEAANSLLKVLEEPPEFATIFLLTNNPGEFLPTIRSRCITVRLAPLPASQLEAYLARNRPEWNAKTRGLIARLSEGAVGRACSFDLEAYTAARKDALVLLTTAIHDQDHGTLFRTTEGYRAGAEGKDKTEQLVRALYSLLQDITFIQSGTPHFVRNTDIAPELGKIAAAVNFRWIADAVQRLGEVESGMRRNLLRSLSLDAFATSLESS